jgi:uncharacterized Zn finger protein (UPF0148 family)
MGFLRRLLGGNKGDAPGSIAAESVLPAELDPSWPVLPERRRFTPTTAEINELPYEATACPSCGSDVIKPPKGRKKCASCGVYMFVVVADRSRRRLVTEAEVQKYRGIEWEQDEKEGAAADREWRKAARAAGLQVARNEDESVSLAVVGESHYQRDLASLMAALATSPNAWSVDAVARLVREPSNRHDRNAVQVVIHGRLVGYLPRDDAEDAQPWLKRIERGGKPVLVAATIRRGRDYEDGHLSPIGVTLEDLPMSAAG